MNLVTIEQSIISLALGIAASIFVHDMHIDKATVVAMTPPQLSAHLESSVKLGGHLHTHAERGSIAQAVKDVNNANSHLHARFRERKHLKGKHLSRGNVATPPALLA
jgi:hypothetical protein